MMSYLQSNIGFSWRGILVVLLALLPNIVFAIAHIYNSFITMQQCL